MKKFILLICLIIFCNSSAHADGNDLLNHLIMSPNSSEYAAAETFIIRSMYTSLNANKVKLRKALTKAEEAEFVQEVKNILYKNPQLRQNNPANVIDNMTIEKYVKTSTNDYLLYLAIGFFVIVGIIKMFNVIPRSELAQSRQDEFLKAGNPNYNPGVSNN